MKHFHVETPFKYERKSINPGKLKPCNMKTESLLNPVARFFGTNRLFYHVNEDGKLTITHVYEEEGRVHRVEIL